LSKITGMETKELRIFVYEYKSVDELPAEDQKLVKIAREAAKNAYAPYSKFHVGAALLLENNEIFSGNNQENASFPVGLCAERVALFAAHAQYPESKIKTLVITASGSRQVLETPVSPCGSCRQVFTEFEHEQQEPMRIILASGRGKIFVFDNAENLLPLSFFSDQLKH